MINTQIVEYIKRQLQVGENQEKTRNDLIANGWTNADVDEAMVYIATQNKPITEQTLPTKNSNKIIPIIISMVVLIILVGGTIFAFNFYKTNYTNTGVGTINNNSVETIPTKKITAQKTLQIYLL